MQNEKRKALLEHESAKLKECDEALQREMREWKAMLMPRKQVGFFVYIVYKKNLVKCC
jgi:STE20-like kinase